MITKNYTKEYGKEQGLAKKDDRKIDSLTKKRDEVLSKNPNADVSGLNEEIDETRESL